MLTLRDEQLEAFEKDCRQRFIARAVSTLTQDYPARFPELPDTEAFVLRGMQEAEENGLNSPPHIRRYLRIMALAGPDLHRRQPFSRLLAQLPWRGTEGVLAAMEEAAGAEA